MKKNVTTLFIFSLFFLIAHPSFSQKAPIKFGKIDMEDLQMTHYPLDSSAHAVILCDYGETKMVYDDTVDDFIIEFDRHIRMKIIDKGGLDYADFEIPLYKNGISSQEKEMVTKFKAATYNLVNGEMVETKTAKKDLLSEEVNENWLQEKIAMPEVKEGSVIDIQYSIRSPFVWNLCDWQFQHEIPVRYSEYNVEYPDWFEYKINFKGYDFDYLTVKDASSKSGTITYNYYKSRIGEHIPSNSDHQSGTIDYVKKQLRYVAEKMPAFVSERYISTAKNYLTAVEFELAAQRMPNSKHKDFTQTWENINKLLMESNSLGDQLGKLKVKSFEDEAAVIKSTKSTPAEQIAAIYYHVKEKVIWNGNLGKYASEDIKKIYKEGKGNDADINLLLIAMLQASDFDANPVVLSTRKNGYVNEWFPNLSQFNYLICAVKMEDGNYLLLDATDRSLPIHLLPARCINGKGMMISKEGYQWLELNPAGKYRHVRQIKAKLTDDLTWAGTMDVKCKDYAARSQRQNFSEEGSEKEYVQMLENEYAGLSLTNPNLEGFESLAEEVKASYEMTMADNVTDGGDLLYFNPMLAFAVDENPFKLKERKYPVDYNYPYEYIYAASFEIPENYTIEELPEKLAIVLPDKGGQYFYSFNVQGNTINLTSQLKINKFLFLPEEYGQLKEFYNLIIDKMAGQVVLKKKE